MTKIYALVPCDCSYIYFCHIPCNRVITIKKYIYIYIYIIYTTATQDLLIYPPTALGLYVYISAKSIAAKVSRHTSVSCSQKAGVAHNEHTDKKKENNIFMHAQLHGPSPKHTILHYSCLPGRIGHIANLIKLVPAICEIWAFKILIYSILFFLSCKEVTGLQFIFVHFAKICYKMQICNWIALIFGTNEERIKVNSHTKFAVNLMNIQGVMSIYSS